MHHFTVEAQPDGAGDLIGGSAARFLRRDDTRISSTVVLSALDPPMRRVGSGWSAMGCLPFV